MAFHGRGVRLLWAGVCGC